MADWMKNSYEHFHRRLGLAILRKSRWIHGLLEMQWFRFFGWKAYIARRTVRPPLGHAAGIGGRLYVDISAICQHDAATGIQRVVRSVAFLLAAREGRHGPPSFVYTNKGRYFLVHLTDHSYVKTLKHIAFQPGDIFFGLDFSLDDVWRMRNELQRMRRNGVQLWYLVHDFLPHVCPEWFSALTVLRFRNWLAVLAGTADGFFCVSQSVANQLHDIMTADFGMDEAFLVEVIPMGWDIANSNPSLGLPEGFSALLSRVRKTPTILMVGTIEPRKGHRHALRAMEVLWRAGAEVQLVIVGGMGWKMADFLAELSTHPENGRRLLQVGKVSDEALGHLYAACCGVLLPSLGEGFGLPLVEALGHGKPVLARRLAVFEPHADKGVMFFDAAIDDEGLAGVITDWLDPSTRLPDVRPDLLPTWQDTVDFIASRLLS